MLVGRGGYAALPQQPRARQPAHGQATAVAVRQSRPETPARDEAQLHARAAQTENGFEGLRIQWLLLN
jgi:hypothetical protein